VFAGGERNTVENNFQKHFNFFLFHISRKASCYFVQKNGQKEKKKGEKKR